MTISVSSAARGLPSYSAGKPPVPGSGPTYKLSSNENPYPPLPGVLEAVATASRQLNRYPDLANVAMTEAMAVRLGVEANRLAFGTGSVAVLYHLLQAICEPGDEVVFAWRSFEAYPIGVPITGAVPILVPTGPGAVHDLAAMRDAVTPSTKAVMLCSPNNPTGPAVGHDEVVDFLDSLPEDVAVVLDQAYVEFVTDPRAVRALELVHRPNVVVLRSFSKAYGLAGFRVGYCVAEATVAAAVRSVAHPFGVSGAAQAAVLASLDHEQVLLVRVAELVRARDVLAGELRGLGFDVPAAEGNFVWLPTGRATGDDVLAFELAGVAVRGYLAGDSSDGIRITVGEPAANALVLEVAAGLPR